MKQNTRLKLGKGRPGEARVRLESGAGTARGSRGGEGGESFDNPSILISLTSKKKVQMHLCPSGLIFTC